MAWLGARERWDAWMRPVNEYFEQARHLECIATQERDLQLRRGFEEQADVCRRLAAIRAKQPGVLLTVCADAEVAA